MAKRKKKAATEQTGIFLSDSLLADDSLSLNAKVIYEIQRGEVYRGRRVEKITKNELAKRIGMSPDTVKRAKTELERKGYPRTPTTTSLQLTGGIVLPDDFLADKELSLEAKVMFAIIKRDIGNGKYTTILNADLIERTGIGKSSIPDILKDLTEAGKITVVHAHGVLKGKKGHNPTPNRPTTTRRIYLSRTLAGLFKGEITKRKQRLEELHDKRRWRDIDESMGIKPKTRAEYEEEEDRRHEEEAQARLTEDLANMTDEGVAEMERTHDVAPGTYLKRKREYLREQEREATEHEDLFDD